MTSPLDRVLYWYWRIRIWIAHRYYSNERLFREQDRMLGVARRKGW
jgi:hypothetical protein